MRVWVIPTPVVGEVVSLKEESLSERVLRRLSFELQHLHSSSLKACSLSGKWRP